MVIKINKRIKVNEFSSYNLLLYLRLTVRVPQEQHPPSQVPGRKVTRNVNQTSETEPLNTVRNTEAIGNKARPVGVSVQPSSARSGNQSSEDTGSDRIGGVVAVQQDSTVDEVDAGPTSQGNLEDLKPIFEKQDGRLIQLDKKQLDLLKQQCDTTPIQGGFGKVYISKYPSSLGGGYYFHSFQVI